jgi:hypothetical protein
MGSAQFLGVLIFSMVFFMGEDFMKQKLYFLAILLCGFVPLFSMEYSAEQMQLANEFRQFVEKERAMRWFKRKMAEKAFNLEQFKADCARKALERKAAEALQPKVTIPAKQNKKPTLIIQTSGPGFGRELTLPERYVSISVHEDPLPALVEITDFDLQLTPKPTNTQPDQAQPAGMLCRTDRKPASFKEIIDILYAKLPRLQQRSSSSLSGRITGTRTNAWI